jgi:hypothetical protein
VLESRTLLSVFTVDRLTDSASGQGFGPTGDLRFCIRNAINDGDIITFGVTGTITLTSALPDIIHGIRITGPGADLLTVSGNHMTRVFNIAVAVPVVISGLTIADGQLGLGVNGAGINSVGILTVADCVFSGNSTPTVLAGGSGGGIYNAGILTVVNSTFSNNAAGGSGGGIGSLGPVTVADSTFNNNFGTDGGGLYNGGSQATIINSVFRDNTAHGEAGGGAGMVNFGTMTLTGSTFSGNVTAESGGGIANGPIGTLAVANSSFSGNSAYSGGGLYSSGTLTVTGSTFSDNVATTSAGGGILIDSRSPATVTNSSFIGNSARANNGGGIANSGMATITDSTFRGNSAFFDGGGIWNPFHSILTVTGSALSDNTAMRGNGGGILSGPLASTTVTNSTLSGNSAVKGSGIANEGGAVTVTNSTLSSNTASSGGAIDSPDFGIYTDGTVAVTSSTLSGNAATTACGGLNQASSASMTVRNSIVAANTAPSSPDVCGAVDSQGHNLIGDGTDSSGWTDTDLAGTQDEPIDPHLGPLQDNGGSIQTMALLAGSPAVNGGDAALQGTADERGVIRTGGVNMGAYQASASALVLSAPAKVTAGAAFDLTVTAVDRFGQVAVGYSGTVTFSSTDPDPGVVLPADYTFTGDDAGVHSFSETTLVTRGQQALTVMDMANHAISASAAVKVRHMRQRDGGSARLPFDRGVAVADRVFATLADQGFWFRLPSPYFDDGRVDPREQDSLG